MPGRTCCSSFAMLASSSRIASVSAVSRSASNLVVEFSVDRAASRNLLPAVAAQGAALLTGGDRIGDHRQAFYAGRETSPIDTSARSPIHDGCLRDTHGTPGIQRRR